MELVHTIAEVRAGVESARHAGNRVAVVPTMGALHEGHLSLVGEARRRAECVVMTIFVNPLQFGPGEDFERYPRDLLNDAAAAQLHGVGIVFAPEREEMYPRSRDVVVKAGKIGDEWEGKIRPGHFDGVLTVVAKLFNIVRADVAIFGQKDLQQAALVSAMVRDLDFPLEIVVAPTVRDPDGLALSSRNRYLTPEDRQHALALPRALRAVVAAYGAGERDVEALEIAGRRILVDERGVKIDYLAVVDRETFKRPAEGRTPSAVIGAIRVGNTRLIDNELLA